MEIGTDFDELNIIGCGGHSRSVADLLLDITPNRKLIFFDDMAKEDEIIMGRYPVKPLSELKLHCKRSYFIAIGDNYIREIKYKELSGYRIISVVSKRAYVSDTAMVGEGCFVGDFSHIGPETRIGYNSIVNTNAIVEHECVIGNSTHISVGARVCGRTVVGNRVFIGAGATVIDSITICDDVIIGAGTVVIEDILEPGTYVGVPAIRIDGDEA